MYTRGTQVGLGLGEVSHSQSDYAMLGTVGADYESTGRRAYAWTWADVFFLLAKFAIITAVTFRLARKRVLLCCGH
jgi:hypothetical protein